MGWDEQMNFLKRARERKDLVDQHISEGYLTDDDASIIIEEVLDSLIEVGNGTSEEDLKRNCDYLFRFRDLWLKNKIKGE